MKTLTRLFIACICVLSVNAPAWANDGFFVETTITVEEEWLEAEELTPFAVDLRLSQQRTGPALGQYGAFRVLNPYKAELVGTIGGRSPSDFAAMLRAFPNISTVQITDCAGTDDDEANFKLARMIRARGMTTYVPSYGSARSGGVELFLAGARRRADDGATFAVHSWRDEDGYEAGDFAITDPVHQDYLRFYRDMGMSDANARAFYQLTNSVGFDDVLWLSKADLARYIAID